MGRKRADQPTNPADVAIGRRIAAYRRAQRMSQRTLGKALDVTFQQVQKYETGKNRISAGKLGVIASTLKVTPVDLLGDGGADHKSSVDAFSALADHVVTDAVMALSKLPAHERRAIARALALIINAVTTLR
jgi:transcriptional regulator with XRE-family HTH domain